MCTGIDTHIHIEAQVDMYTQRHSICIYTHVCRYRDAHRDADTLRDSQIEVQEFTHIHTKYT